MGRKPLIYVDRVCEQMILKCLLSSTEDLLIDSWKELLFVFMWERKKSDLFLNKILEELALVC